MVLLLASFGFAQAQGQGQGQMSPGDQQFAEDAAMGSAAEIELANLAAQKATSPEVKKFAQMMVSDHTKASQMLDQVAQKKGMSVPKEVPEHAQKFRDRLNSMSGKDFDMAYMQHMFVDHAKDSSKFQLYTQTGKDSDLKSFAQQQVPTLKQHFNESGRILKSMGVTAPSLGTPGR